MDERSHDRAGRLPRDPRGRGTRPLLREGRRRACSTVSSRAPSPRSCPTVGWRIYTVGAMPNIDPATYRLRVDGLVESPQTFTLADLKAMPRAEQVSDFQCVTGWVVKDVRWAGVRINDVLERGRRARKAPSALTFVSAEVPYSDSLTLRAGAAPGRDARLRDGRQAALARPRRPRAARDAARCTATRASSGSITSSSAGSPTTATGSRTGTTRTPGSGGRTALASEPAAGRRLRRFDRTERTLHWTHASAFFALLATGLILYLPSLSTLIAHRQIVKNVHLWVARRLGGRDRRDPRRRRPAAARRRTGARSSRSTGTTVAGCAAGTPRRAASTQGRR